MSARVTGFISIGALSGLMCFVIALVRGSTLFPLAAALIWGACAPALLSRVSGGTAQPLSSQLIDAIGTGAIAAVFFLVPAFGSLLALSRVQFPAEFSGGVSLPSYGWDGDTIVAVAIFGLVGIPSSSVAGSFAARLAAAYRREDSRSDVSRTAGRQVLPPRL